MKAEEEGVPLSELLKVEKRRTNLLKEAIEEEKEKAQLSDKAISLPTARKFVNSN